MNLRNFIASASIVLATTFASVAFADTSTGSIQVDVQSAVSQGSVSVFVKDGVAILYGNVPTVVDANAAARAAARFPGINSVENHIYTTH